MKPEEDDHDPTDPPDDASEMVDVFTSDLPDKGGRQQANGDENQCEAGDEKKSVYELAETSAARGAVAYVAAARVCSQRSSYPVGQASAHIADIGGDKGQHTG